MGPAEEIQTFERKTLLGKKWFFRIVDCGNNEIIAASESYNSKAARDKTAIRFAHSLRCAVVPGKPR